MSSIDIHFRMTRFQLVFKFGRNQYQIVNPTRKWSCNHLCPASNAQIANRLLYKRQNSFEQHSKLGQKIEFNLFVNLPSIRFIVKTECLQVMYRPRVLFCVRIEKLESFKQELISFGYETPLCYREQLCAKNYWRSKCGRIDFFLSKLIGYEWVWGLLLVARNDFLLSCYIHGLQDSD